MKDHPIDDLELVEIPPRAGEKQARTTRTVLSLIGLLTGFIGYRLIISGIHHYFSYRNKWLLGFEVHQVALAVSLAVLPLIAFNCWLKRSENKGYGSYLWMMALTLVLFVLFVFLGFEWIISFGKRGIDENPFLPSYTVLPPVPLFLDLLIILAALFSLLTMKVLFRRKTAYRHKQ